MIALLAGGILAASGLIVAKKPNAKELIDKLVPYQAIIGVALLGLGVVNFLWWVTHGLFSMLAVSGLFGITIFVMTIDSILLGLVFGMPQIVKWLPGEGAAEQKGMELSKKLAPFQGVLGVIGLAAALLALLYRLRIL
ncbi:MAG TPA: hypothetical protein VK601_26350 [Kofleriaceae bacterium]|nr:hypothetical protein [Kofleriaceae bacterium]